MQMRDLLGVVITFAVIGIAFSILPTTTDQVQANQRVGVNVVNESITPTLGQATYATSPAGKPITGVVFVANRTYTLPSNNVTFNSTYIIINWGTDTNRTGVVYNVSYGYTGETASSVVAGNATSGLGQLASWLPTIAIVIAASIVIGLLLRSFVFRKGD